MNRLTYDREDDIIMLNDLEIISFETLREIKNMPGINGVEESIRILNGLLHPQDPISIDEVEFLEKLFREVK